ncbi:hypothetical protein GF357_00875 [Candidatus Dojkabacteria bacterium]|nr:hypothetical protein [Candidatus Dojkabacteria bacterium]
MFRRELLYTILIFALLQLLTLVMPLPYFVAVSWIGLLLLLTWILISFITYSGKKVSRFSEVIIKMQLKARWYQYIFVPVIFYTAICGFIFFVNSVFLQQFVILLGCLCLFLLMVHVRSTYQKIYTVSRISRVVFDLVNIMLFYLVAMTLQVSGYISIYLIIGILSLLSVMILVSSLGIAHKLSNLGIFLSILGGITIAVVGYLTRDLNIYTFPFIATLTFYAILSFWHIRLSGVKKLDQYIPPLLFLIMAIILVMG